VPLYMYIQYIYIYISVFVCVMKELCGVKEQKSQLETQLHRLNLAYTDVKSQIQHGDFKIDNYDRIKT